MKEVTTLFQVLELRVKKSTLALLFLWSYQLYLLQFTFDVVDILIVGVGEKSTTLDVVTQQLIRKKGINLEVLPTEHACTTFNFLNVEKRYVAAALIPPCRVKPYISDGKSNMD